MPEATMSDERLAEVRDNNERRKASLNTVDGVTGIVRLDMDIESMFVETSELLAEVERLRGENAKLRAENATIREAIRDVAANSYLDDDVLNRHSATTVGCESLKSLFELID